MALSTTEQAELDELVNKRKAKLKARLKAMQEAEVASLEVRAFLAERGLRTAKTTDGHAVEIVEIIDFRHINAVLVEQDFPRDMHPELYVPDYKTLKDLANHRVGATDPNSTAAVSKYTGFTQQLRVRKLKKVYRRKK